MFIGPCDYGILRDIRHPVQSILVHTNPKTPLSSKPKASKNNKKTTCCENRATNRKRDRSVGKESKQATSEKRARTLSESRSKNYGITPPPRTLRNGLLPIDYLTLDDGFDNDTVISPRKRKRAMHRPRIAPSATRVATQKHTTSSEEQSADKKSLKLSMSALSAIPSTSKASNIATPILTGVLTLQNADTLPDLVLNRETLNPELPSSTGVDPVSTEEELDAIDALLSLGEVRDNVLEDDDNAELMPVGAPTNNIDVAPVPVTLDQLNVDTAIAEIVQAEEFKGQAKEDDIPNPDVNINRPNNEENDASIPVESSVTDRPTSAWTEDRPKSAIAHARFPEDQNTRPKEKVGEQSEVQVFCLWHLRKINASCKRTSS